MVEMIKKYQVARREILDERELATPEARLTKYITNPNYVYEPLGEDTIELIQYRKTSRF